MKTFPCTYSVLTSTNPKTGKETCIATVQQVGETNPFACKSTGGDRLTAFAWLRDQCRIYEGEEGVKIFDKQLAVAYKNDVD